MRLQRDLSLWWAALGLRLQKEDVIRDLKSTGINPPNFYQPAPLNANVCTNHLGRVLKCGL